MGNALLTSPFLYLEMTIDCKMWHVYIRDRKNTARRLDPAYRTLSGPWQVLTGPGTVQPVAYPTPQQGWDGSVLDKSSSGGSI